MSCHSHNIDCREACKFLYLWGKLAYDSTRLCELSEFFAWKSEGLEYVLINITCDRIKQLGSRGNGIFTNGFACKHID